MKKAIKAIPVKAALGKTAKAAPEKASRATPKNVVAKPAPNKSPGKPKARAGASQQSKAPAPAMFWQWLPDMPHGDNPLSALPLIVKDAQIGLALSATPKVWLDLSEKTLQDSHIVTLPAMNDVSQSAFGLALASKVAELNSLGTKTWILIDADIDIVPPHAHIKTRNLNGKKRTLWLKPTAVPGAWELRAAKETTLVSGAELKICVRDETWKRVRVTAIEGAVNQESWLTRAREHADQVTGFVLPIEWSMAEKENAVTQILAEAPLSMKTWVFPFAGIPAWTKDVQAFARSLSRLTTSTLCFDYEAPQSDDTLPAGPGVAMTMTGLKHLEIPVLHRVSARMAATFAQNVECWAPWMANGDGVIFLGDETHALMQRASQNVAALLPKIRDQNDVAPSKAK